MTKKTCPQLKFHTSLFIINIVIIDIIQNYILTGIKESNSECTTHRRHSASFCFYIKTDMKT